MPNIQFRNFARSTLSIGAASGALSLTVASGTGSRFPTLTGAQYFYATLENAALVREIVRVTARTGDTLTVVRAQDNTTAQSWNAGDTIALRLNAKAIEEAVVGTLLAANNLSDLADAPTALTNLGAQAADAATAKTNVAQDFTLPQRSSLQTDNDLSFDLNAKQNFRCTTVAGGALTFANQADGISGFVLLTNAANHAITAAASTKITATDLSRIQTTGTYRLDYATDGTNAYVSVTGPFV